MAQRLAVLPRPEVVLLAGLMTGPMHVAAEAWVAAVHVEVQDEHHHCEDMVPRDCSGNSANDPEVPLTSIDNHDETSAGSVCAAHTSTRDKASQGRKLTNAAVTAESGGDGADTKVRANEDQMPLPWSDEEQPPIEQALLSQEEEKPPAQDPPQPPGMPARATDRKNLWARPRTQRSKMEELTEPVPEASDTFAEISGRANDADPLEPCSPDVQAAGDVATPDTQNDLCGWCGSTEVSPLDSTQGRIHCQACYAVSNPTTGLWHPGDRDKQQSPPVSAPATNCTMPNEINLGPTEATANSTERGGAFGDTVAAHQGPPAGPHDDGEAHPRECREIA
jgi:hypothetical protein